MIAEDARWGMDVILSGQSGDISGYLPLLLGHHWVRIAYEGARVLRSPDPATGVPALAELLRDRYAAITARGRHAAKLLDDTKKGYDHVLAELDAVLDEHNAQLTGNASRWLRRLETDLGLYTISGKVAGASISAGYRLGLELGDGGRIAGEAIGAVSEEWGGTLAVLGAAALEARPPSVTLDLERANIGYRDRLAAKYFRGRFGQDYGLGLKSVLLLVEGDLNTSVHLLPITATGHETAVFRARTVTLYHALTAVRQVLDRDVGPDTAPLRALRGLLDDAPAARLLSNEGRQVRNVCVHYVIRTRGLPLDWSLPMFGLIESLFPGNTWQGFDDDLIDTARRLSECLDNWRS